jgi:hypothetical protein
VPQWQFIGELSVPPECAQRMAVELFAAWHPPVFCSQRGENVSLDKI